MTTWSPDFLVGYETTELALPGAEPAPGEPADVELVATLIRKSGPRIGTRAVFYLHGWNDYFFQTHLADYLTDLGYDFYAVDFDATAVASGRGNSGASSPISTITLLSSTLPPT